MNVCQDCGMVCQPTEYHPMAACLMFKACHDGDQVRANLKAVQDDAIRALSGEAAEQIYLASLGQAVGQEAKHG